MGDDDAVTKFHYTPVISAIDTDYHFVTLSEVSFCCRLTHRFSVVADYRGYFFPIRFFPFPTKASICLHNTGMY